MVLLAELPEQDAAFYGVKTEDGGEKALLRWDENLAEFDWGFVTPRNIEPRLWRFDADGDGQDELMVDCL